MNELNQRQAVMTLCALPGLGPVRIGRLLDAFGGHAPQILDASLSALREVSDIGPETAATVARWRTRFDVAKEEDALARMGASYVLKGEPGYPAKLAQLVGAPHGLYVKGCVPACPAVAIVGTRRPTLYGRREARRFATDLARAGLCVVSGLARGIDGEAHEGALDAHGRTVAFLGCGLDVIYPPEHEKLYERISAEGAVLSEFSLGRQPDAQTFPQRNRLISGMADAILVVESDLKGGSMITARFAAEQGRSVFAMPGRIDQPSSRGCHALIRDGATLVTTAQEIIDEISVQVLPMIGAAPAAKAQGGKAQGELSFGTALSDDEKKVLGALADGAVMHPEAVARTCVLSQQAAMAALMLLELKHLVARRPDASYEMQSRAGG
jgi:DNA processing protein